MHYDMIQTYAKSQLEYPKGVGIKHSLSVKNKINSYLSTLKDKKSEEEISSFDISGKQKCFVISNSRNIII